MTPSCRASVSRRCEGTYIFRYLGFSILEGDGDVFLQNGGTTHPTTQRHIPHDRSPHLHHCENSEKFDICYKEKGKFNADKLIYLKRVCPLFTQHNVSLTHYPGICLKKLGKTRQIIRRVASGIRIRHSEIQVQKITAALTCSVKYLHNTKQTSRPCSLSVNKTYPFFPHALPSGIMDARDASRNAYDSHPLCMSYMD